jgi:hypothetical protein
MPTSQLAVPDRTTGRLVVKFHDEIRARPQNGAVRSVARYDLRAFNIIIRRYGLSARPALSPSPERLAEIEARAAAYSGQAQPDLAGMLYVEGDGGVPLAAAAALNNLDYVEFVEYEPELSTQQAATGACCQQGGVCVVVTFDQCAAANGTYLGDGTTCGGPCGACCQQDDTCIEVSPDFCVAIPAPAGPGVFVGGNCDAVDCSELDEPDCGVALTGDCFDPNNGSPYCDLEQLCVDVCDIDPFCCDDTGDVVWPGRGGTGVGHWDEWCADHALEFTGSFFGGPGPPPPVNDPAAATPSFADAQGYQTAASWSAPPPANIAWALRYDADGWPNLLDGYSGEGYDLQGIWNVGEILIDVGIADRNLTRGRSIKVGVVELAAFIYGPNDRGALGTERPYRHEDLHGKVVVEGPNNAFLIIPGSADSTGDHGTATLSIIGAIDQDAAGNPVSGLSPSASLAAEVGMVGMVPDAKLYFFSAATVSGGGLVDAIARALDAGFGPGDVLSFSITLAGTCNTLNNSFSVATMLSAANGAGVTCCIAAGNDCCNLDTNPWEGDTGAIIVGGCFPGRGPSFNQYCRLPFSNYCQTCDENTHQVHISAWGTTVASAGYGDLFVGNSNNANNRSYSSTFGGTSAATPMVASLVASLQGLSKMMWGIPLSPGTMRSLVSGHGFWQCGLSPDNLPGSTAIPFFPCLEGTAIMNHGDWNMDETGNLIALSNISFTSAFRVAEEVVAGSFFDGNPLVDEIEILVGQLIEGNVNSIKASDDAHLVISSELTNPTGPEVSKRGDIITGLVTDVLVESHVQFDNVDNLTIAAETFVTSGAGIVLCYIYNWDFGQWMVGGVAFLTGDPDEVVFFPIGNASQFIHSGDQQVRFRIQTVSGAFGPTYEAFHDFIGLTAGGNPIVPSDGP